VTDDARTGGAGDVHRAALVVDTHVDTAQRLVDERFDLADPLDGGGQLNLDALVRGGVGAVFFALWADPAIHAADPLGRCLALAAAIHAQVAGHPDRLAAAASVDEVLAARRAGKISVLLGLEGAEALVDDLGALARLHALGVRYVGLTWNHHNAIADAAAPAIPRHGGLSSLGRRAVGELNRLGIMVDVSHLSDASTAQAIEASRAPVIASHSGARARAAVARNLPDDLIRAIAAKGGVVQVVFHGAFLDEECAAREKAAFAPVRAELEALDARLAGADARERGAARARHARAALGRLPRAPLSALLDHVEHVARVAGVDHVGLGSDFDGGIVPPEGIDSPADLPRVTEGLLERGFSAEQVTGILGRNLLRVFGEVERVGAELRGEG
jgi:membrane dipeptidase